MPKSADLNPTKMKAAIRKLKRRINELKEMNADAVQKGYDPELILQKNKVNGALRDILGADTIEYEQYYVRNFATWSIYGYPLPPDKVNQGIKDHIQRVTYNLTTVIDLLEEKLDDFEETQSGKGLKTFGNLALHPEIGKASADIDLFKENLDDFGETQSGKALKTLDNLALHPEIDKASADLFKDKYYSNAVESACKALNLLVKSRSGRDDLDGTDLMLKVFSPEKPTLKFNKLKTDSEKSEQRGMMYLFAGVISALRNPRAHDFIDDDPESTLEKISFISFLAKSLDKTKKQN